MIDEISEINDLKNTQETLNEHINEKYLTYCLEEFIQREKYYDEKLEFFVKNAQIIGGFIQKSFLKNNKDKEKAQKDWQGIIKLIGDHKISTSDYLIKSAINPVHNKAYVHPGNLIGTLKTFSSYEHIELLKTKIKLLAELSKRYESLMLPFLKTLPTIPKNTILYEQIEKFFTENYPAEPDKQLQKREFSLKDMLADLLISPVQKLAKYKTQISDLIKNIQKESPLYKDVDLLLQAAEMEANEANNLLKRTGYRRRSTQSLEKNPDYYIYLQNILRLTDFCLLTPLGRKLYQDCGLKKTLAISDHNVKILEEMRIAVIKAYFEMQSEEITDSEIFEDLQEKLVIVLKKLRISKNILLKELVQTIENIGKVQELPKNCYLKVDILKLKQEKDIAKSFREQREKAEKYIELNFLHFLILILNKYKNQQYGFFKQPYDTGMAIINRLKEKISLLYQAIESDNILLKNNPLEDKNISEWIIETLKNEIFAHYGNSHEKINHKNLKATLSKFVHYLNQMKPAHKDIIKLKIESNQLIDASESTFLNQTVFDNKFKVLNFQSKSLENENEALTDRKFFMAVQKHLLNEVKSIFIGYEKELEKRTGIYGFFKNTTPFKVQAFEQIFNSLLDLLSAKEAIADNLPDLIEAIRQIFISSTKKCGEVEKMYLKGDFGKAFLGSLKFLNNLSTDVNKKLVTGAK